MRYIEQPVSWTDCRSMFCGSNSRGSGYVASSIVMCCAIPAMSEFGMVLFSYGM
jgi:hypothetical protein